MINKIIIINGFAKSKKDTFVRLFADHYPGRTHNISSVELLKKIARKHLGWDDGKTDPARKLLSEMKRIWSEYNDGPFHYVVNKITRREAKHPETKNIFFIHCREPREIQKFKDHYGDLSLTLFMDLPVDHVPDNESDRNVRNYEYDRYINGIETDVELKELEEEARRFTEEFVQEHPNIKNI